MVSMIEIRADFHYRAIKNRVFDHLRMAKTHLNFKMSRSLDLKCVGFISGVHGKFGNAQWHTKMIRKALGDKDIEAEVLKKNDNV